MWPQPRSVTPPCPPLVLHEDHGKLRARVRRTLGADAGRCEIRRCVSDKICHSLYYVPRRGVRTSGKTRGGVFWVCGVFFGKGGGTAVRLFEGSRSSRLSLPALKSLSESLFVPLPTSFSRFLYPAIQCGGRVRRNEHGAPACVDAQLFRVVRKVCTAN